MSYPRLIIIDGPDGAGKTTLAARLASHLVKEKAFDRVSVIHHGPYKGEPKIAPRYFIPMAQTLQDESSALIMDRSWLAEPIYDRIFQRGGSRICTAERRMLERVALGLDAMTIIALPPVEACVANRAGTEDTAAVVSQAHAGFVQTSTRDYRAHEFDYTLPGAWEDLLDMMTRSTFRAVNQGPGIGHYHWNSVVLVGDRPNSAKHGDLKHRAPFISFGGRTGCSHWIAEQLEEAGVGEDRLYWINAYDCEGRPTLNGFIQKLQPRAVIALGREASTWCSFIENNPTIDVPVHHVDHPQHWKRFHNNERYPLGGLIKEHLA